MAAGNIKGITIEFKAKTTSLGKALSEIKSKSSGVDEALRNVNKALKFNPGNAELIAQKQVLLRQKVQQTKDSLEALKAAQRSMDASGVDKTSSEYMELRREIITTESRLKHFNQELKSVSSPQLKAIGAQLTEIGDKALAAGKKTTTYATAPIVGAYTYAAKAASDYNENVNKVDVAFGKSKKTVMDWAKTATSRFGLSKNAALEAASLFGDMGTSMGLSQSTAADMSTTLAGLAGDLASFKNISTDEAMTALKGVFTGETESLKNLGVMMTQTDLEKFAADQGKVYKSMSESEKVMLRYQYVLARTKNAQGDYANTNDQAANAIRTFKGSVDNLAIAFGQNVLPVVTPLIVKVTDLINKFAELDPKTQKIITIMAAIAAAVGPLLMVIGSIASGVGAIMALPFASSLLPIAGIIAGIAAAAYALYLVVKGWPEFWAQLKQGWIENWQVMKDQFNAFWEGVKSLASAGVARLKSIWDGIKSIASTAASVFLAVNHAMTHPIETAVAIIRAAINKIKSILAGTKLQLPKIKLPHFSVKGGKAPYGIGGKGSLPKFDVSWHKDGFILDKPSLFGFANGKFQGGGEAGSEAMLPLNPFWKEMDEMKNGLIAGVQVAIAQSIAQMTPAMAGAMSDAMANVSFNVDGRELVKATVEETVKQTKTLNIRAERQKGRL